jgi:hypothetical protein
MWLMSQEQGLWLERPEEVDSGKREEPTIQASSKVANGGFLTDPVAARKVAREVIKKSTASDESEVEVIERQPAKEIATTCRRNVNGRSKSRRAFQKNCRWKIVT